MSQPTRTPPTGVSGSSGVTMGEINVSVLVEPQANGDVHCDLDYNGSQVRVIYREAGDVDFDQFPFNE
jgi:hypothetical protein